MSPALCHDHVWVGQEGSILRGSWRRMETDCAAYPVETHPSHALPFSAERDGSVLVWEIAGLEKLYCPLERDIRSSVAKSTRLHIAWLRQLPHKVNAAAGFASPPGRFCRAALPGKKVEIASNSEKASFFRVCRFLRWREG